MLMTELLIIGISAVVDHRLPLRPHCAVPRRGTEVARGACEASLIRGGCYFPAAGHLD
jgi:hypothetical protein